MSDVKNEPQEHPSIEKLEAVGQIIVGEIEKIGGILTGDPITQAEGEYNVEAGSLHLKSTKGAAGEEDESDDDRGESG